MMVMMVTDDYDGNRLQVRETYLRLSSLSHLVELFVMVTMMMVVMMMVVTTQILKC